MKEGSKVRQLDLNGKDGKEISRIVRKYEEFNDRFMPRLLLDKIKKYYAEGLDADVIIRALEITTVREAHFEYTEGILKRLIEEGITTLYLWEKKLLFKKSRAEFQKRFPASDEKELDRLALFRTFEKELKEEQDKLNAYLANPYPIDIEIPRLTDEIREGLERGKAEILAENAKRRARGEMICPPFF